MRAPRLTPIGILIALLLAPCAAQGLRTIPPYIEGFHPLDETPYEPSPLNARKAVILKLATRMFSDTAQIDLATSEQVKTFRSRLYHYDRQIDLPFGEYSVRVAFGSGGESLGKAEAPLTIGAWDGRSLALSGIALSREARKAEGLVLELDPSLLEGHRPLIARSLEVTPSADSRWRSTEQCFGYLELYDSDLAGPNSTAPRLRIGVLDRQTKRVLQSGDLDLASYLRPSHPTVPVIFQVPVRALPAGAYTLEVRASLGTRSAVRTVDFEVE